MSCSCSNKSLVRKKVFRVLAIVWMVVIFSFSASEADESQELSLTVGDWIAHILISDFDSWPEAEQLAFTEKIDFPIRKCAHASEYTILAFLLAGTMYDGRKDMCIPCGEKARKKLILCIAIGVLYACSDEIHQLFVPGRAGRIFDVAVDSIGVLAGTWIGMKLFDHISAKRKKCKETM